MRRKRRSIWEQPLLHEQPKLSAAEWSVIRLALETQERVMLKRGAHQAAEIARALRQKLS
jgi:hypothetical protein